MSRGQDGAKPERRAAIVGIDSLLLRSADFEADCHDYECLFARPARRGEVRGGTHSEPSALFVLANCAFELRPAKGPQGEAASGLAALRLSLQRALAPGDDLRRLAGEELQERLASVGSQPAEVQREAWLVDPRLTRGVRVELTHPPLVEQVPAQGGDEGTEDRTDGTDGIYGIDHAVIRSADADATRGVFADRLGIRVAFDREFPQWGARLIMCKLGPPGDDRASVVEIAGALPADSTPGDGRDRFGGITWRVGDVAATRRRLADEGFDVSAVREGRRPGTRVCTVRSRTGGVPTLLIEPAKQPSS
ncbi:MAG: hypothetical protein DWQ36_18935 [Acidobacteria bacterium]|nr:MAG: hypothetical protein DWQ30_11260 [Acidobacteriota bacterium]REK03849.1 MAG: hypothetical protein DWQ36_18935 [Acidobacteriota bacterium]